MGSRGCCAVPALCFMLLEKGCTVHCAALEATAVRSPARFWGADAVLLQVKISKGFCGLFWRKSSKPWACGLLKCDICNMLCLLDITVPCLLGSILSGHNCHWQGQGWVLARGLCPTQNLNRCFRGQKAPAKFPLSIPASPPNTFCPKYFWCTKYCAATEIPYSLFLKSL